MSGDASQTLKDIWWSFRLRFSCRVERLMFPKMLMVVCDVEENRLYLWTKFQQQFLLIETYHGSHGLLAYDVL